MVAKAPKRSFSLARRAWLGCSEDRTCRLLGRHVEFQLSLGSPGLALAFPLLL